MMERSIRITFEPGISDEHYEKFFESVQDLAEEMMAKYPEDCTNEIFVSCKGM